MRRPVNEPGPLPKAMASSSPKPIPAEAISASIIGNIICVCWRGTSSNRSLTSPLCSTAQEQASVEASRANSVGIGKIVERVLTIKPQMCGYRQWSALHQLLMGNLRARQKKNPPKLPSGDYELPAQVQRRIPANDLSKIPRSPNFYRRLRRY